MQILSQRNPAWAFKTIGPSKETVGAKGCVITSTSMGSSYFGKFFDPGYLAKYLSFTNSGLLIWSSVKNISMKFIWRGYRYEQQAIDAALKNPKRICLLNVDGSAHWVLGIHRVPLTKKFWVADPWDGKRKFYSGVVGYSIIEKA